jgi:hypothetical protein
MDRREAANLAISSAMAILNMLLHEPDIRGAIVGVPLFTHTMVAFCAAFLLKVAWLWDSSGLTIDPRQVQNLVKSVVDVMQNVSAGEKHLAYHIAGGLSKMLDRLENRKCKKDADKAKHLADVDGMMIPPQQPQPQDVIVDSFELYGLDFGSGWNDFGSSFDFFPLAGSGNDRRQI